MNFNLYCVFYLLLSLVAMMMQAGSLHVYSFLILATICNAAYYIIREIKNGKN